MWFRTHSSLKGGWMAMVRYVRRLRLPVLAVFVIASAAALAAGAPSAYGFAEAAAPEAESCPWTRSASQLKARERRLERLEDAVNRQLSRARSQARRGRRGARSEVSRLRTKRTRLRAQQSHVRLQINRRHASSQQCVDAVPPVAP